MDRRTFLGACAAAPAAGCAFGGPSSAGGTDGESAGDGGGRFVGYTTIDELLDGYRGELMDEIIPAWYRSGIDREHGGVYYPVERDGTVPSTDKRGWYQGRGLWTFSHIYSAHDPDDRHLETARLIWEFIRDHGIDENGDFHALMTREGEPKNAAKDIFSDIYGAYGMIEYYRASNDAHALALARKTILRVTERILAPTFQYRAGYEPGTNTLGIWLHFLPVLTQFLIALPIDLEIEGIAKLAVRRIMHRHIDRERRTAFELLEGATLEPFPEPENRWNWVCHTTQAMWMIMDEARRIGEPQLVIDARRVIEWMIDAGWDTEYGGMADIVYWDSPEDTTWNKSMWGHCETLLALLRCVEHFPDSDWAAQWYHTLRIYAYEVFPDREYGNWFVSLERDGSRAPGVTSMEIFHRPRSVMLSIECLERMKARDVSK